jgi:phosphatidylglycerophosphatase A
MTTTVRRFIASWFGTGLILRRFRGVDGGSGTLGAAATLPVVWLLHPLGWIAQLMVAAVVTAASVWASGAFADSEGDPGWVVVDEAAGTLVATIGLGLTGAAVAFLVFRIADITKRFPGVAAAERLPGGVGITADDIVAGVWALGAGWLAQLAAG